MRAALTAALRVTVSTSLIGCGAHASTDGGGGAMPRDTHDPATSRPDGGVDSGRAEPNGGRSGSESDEASGSAGVISGSTMGGSGAGNAGGDAGSTTASAAGESSEGGAGTTPQTACEAVATCLGALEAMTFASGEPLPSAAAECCQVVIEGLSAPSEAAVCDPETLRALDSRFMGSRERSACCADPDTWQQRACTPWGPAVPPELPLQALAAWELAA
jgi:hypothetical protein